MIKYPRTPHLTGSRLQKGDEDMSVAGLAVLRGHFIVVEEKVDGANAGVSFDARGQLRLQSRGHVLTGGPRERHFNLLKRWAHAHRAALWEVLGDRYLMYGEWLYAKHTVFYDALPHFFLEFDVLDTHEDVFLSTERRRALLASLPVVSVPVLSQGLVERRLEPPLQSLISPTRYKSATWRGALERSCRALKLDPVRAQRQTDASDLMEGLYLKVESHGEVVARYKWVRASFEQAIAASDSHWHSRPIIPNQLAEGVDIFEVSP